MDADNRGRHEAFLNALTLGVIGVALALAAYSKFGGVHTGNRITSAVPKTVESWRSIARSGHRIGSTTAPIVVSEFSDYQCPFCVKTQGVLEKLLLRYNGNVAVAVHHWPQPALHPQSLLAANAAECASDQGAFTPFHRAVLERAGVVDSVSLLLDARKAGVSDLTRFQRCLSAREHASSIAADVVTAQRIGAQGTPFFLVNRQVIQGAQPESVFVRLIDEQLRAIRARAAN